MQQRGNFYEDMAASFLQEQGLSILARNFRCKAGEIDLICTHNGELVFVEVRYRSNPRYAGAFESITRTKQRKLARAAQLYLQQNPTYYEAPCRFDAIAIAPSDADGKDHVQWLQHAFLNQ